MIKSKIDARERALELAVALANARLAVDYAEVDVTAITKEFEAYLIGDADLPEVADDAAHIKELFDIANKEMNKIRQQGDDKLKELKP